MSEIESTQIYGPMGRTRIENMAMGGSGRTQMVTTREVTRYSGYPFGLHIPQREKDNKMLG